MNLDDLKNQARTVKAPETLPARSGANTPAADDVIARLKALEANENQSLKKARPLWLIAAALFCLVFLLPLVLPPAEMRPARLWFFGVLAVIYVLNAVLLTWKLRLHDQIDYTESVRGFLEKAESRLQFMRPQDRWLAGIGLVILGVTGGFYVQDTILRRYLGADHHPLGIAVYGAGYVTLCVAALAVTYRNWRRTKAPLLEEIRKLRRDLTTNETGAAA